MTLLINKNNWSALLLIAAILKKIKIKTFEFFFRAIFMYFFVIQCNYD